MINLHPTDKQLQQFAEGTIDQVMGIIVSAHVDMCECCQQKVREFEAEASEAVFDSVPASTGLTTELEEMMAAILADESMTPQVCPIPTSRVELDGRYFQVPRALRSLIDRSEGWSHMVGRLWQASVNLTESKKGHFVFLGPGAQVPEHTHKGNEITLVVDGEFEDEYGLYKEGDFIVRNGAHKHTPKTVSDNGCLVFTVVDQPLHFTSGIARLLNPFSHRFFS